MSKGDGSEEIERDLDRLWEAITGSPRAPRWWSWLAGKRRAS